MKMALFTDIHWGARGNSIEHNQDCTDFIDWTISQINQHKCTALWFGGDWHENRNSINVATLNASFNGLKKLNDLNIPIFFTVGNHDLYHRENRNEISTYHFSQFKNIKLINNPFTVTSHGSQLMFFPYLFQHEYPAAAALITKHEPKYVFGHFEFKGFIVTGSSDRRMEHGLDHSLFAGPTYVFSGHFHKRQALDNVIYPGNCFPTNFGDAWEDDRGMAILDTSNDDVQFLDWEECPKFRRIRLSQVLSKPDLTFPQKCRVKCILDTEIGYSDAQQLREEMIKNFNLREFTLEENLIEKKDAIEGEDVKDNFDFSSLNDAVISMLDTGITGTSTINSKLLIEIYKTL